MSTVHYYFHDEITGRVCGTGTVDSEVWDVHQEALRESKDGYLLKMTPITDLDQLHAMHAEGPQNHRVTETGELEVIPEAAREAAPEMIVIADIHMEQMIRRQDAMLAFFRDEFPQIIEDATVKGLNRVMKS